MSRLLGPPEPPSSNKITTTNNNQTTVIFTGGSSTTSDANFDMNMVIILAALLCALFCALGLKSIVRCALRWADRLTTASDSHGDHQLELDAVTAGGIEKRVLRKLPIEVYESSSTNNDVVCAICLGEFVDGEKVRVLPRCGHGFHVQCIDTWLVSHASCPICRGRVGGGSGGGSGAGDAVVAPVGDGGVVAVVVA